MKHNTRVYTTLETFLSEAGDNTTNRVRWKKHVEKHGRAPLILKCCLCHPKGKNRKREFKETHAQ